MVGSLLIRVCQFGEVYIRREEGKGKGKDHELGFGSVEIIFVEDEGVGKNVAEQTGEGRFTARGAAGY